MAVLITATGPTALRTYVFPDANATMLTSAAAVTPAQGGTGLATYAVGDLLYASGATTLAKLADVAINQVLVSGGVGVAPAWSANPTISGSIAVTGDINANHDVVLANARFLYWGTRTLFASPADGQLNISNNAAAAGVGFDVATDAILKVRTRAQSADAAMKASFYTSSTIAALTITANVIAPTALIHQVGAGLIKTITVPATMASPGFLFILPTAAFTYDATGNILVPAGGGTAVVNKLMVFVWDSTKWTPSY